MPKLRTFVIFGLVGPPLGWLVYAIGLIAGDARTAQSASGLGETISLVLFGMLFSYVIGLIPALLTALLMVAGPSILSIRPGPGYATLVGLVCGVVFAALFLSGTDSSGLGDAGYFLLKVLTCLVPTLICWWLVRSKRSDINEESNEAVQR
jgi:hypothetical protein